MHHVIMDDNIRLDAELTMPSSLEEKVPLCIIIHGFTGNKEERHLLAVSDMMNEIGMATLRVDMYGHGKSDGEFKNHTLYKWLNNAMAVIDYARKLPGISRIYLCGHSQGGLTVAMVGAMKREQISGIIPMSPALMIPEQARAGNILGLEVDLHDGLDEYTSKDGWTLNSNYVRVARTIYPEEEMKHYKGPVLIVHGEADQTVPIELVRESSKCYSNCKFVSIPEDSHCYDYHLDKVVEEIKKYMLENKWNV